MDELFKIERKTVWLIIPMFALYLFTGYSLTRLHLISKLLAAYLHFVVCGFFAALILIHVLGRARNALARFKIKGSKIDALLLIIGIIALALLAYVEFA